MAPQNDATALVLQARRGLRPCLRLHEHHGEHARLAIAHPQKLLLAPKICLLL
jgi:hypothetical protein